MVYCGKPSKACRQCRKMNIKCDKKKDSCGQCTRAKLQCPGYHEPGQLVFRDQTAHVVQKIYKRGSESRESSESSDVPLALPVSVEDRAKALFIGQHVLGGLRTLDYMRTFYAGRILEPDLAVAVKAVSLAFFSREFYAPSLLLKAREKYGSALVLTNSALQSPKTAVKDTTLLTILLLDLFEKLVNEGQGVEAQAKHMNGALALVKLRGRKQFRDKIGMRMFGQLSSNILVRCLEDEIRVPPEFLALHEFSSQYYETSNSQWQLSDLLVRFVDLVAARKSGGLPNSASIIAANSLDEQAHLLCTSLPRDSACRNGSESENSQTANQLRAIRILFNEIIQEESITGIDIHEQIKVCTSTVVTSLLDQIHSSIPKNFQTSPDIKPPSSPIPSNIASHENKHQIFRAKALLFPLYIVARSPFCTLRMHEDIIEYFNFTADVLKIQEAVALRGMLEHGGNKIPWRTCNLLDCLTSAHYTDF